jgi:hypothetical protein
MTSKYDAFKGESGNRSAASLSPQERCDLNLRWTKGMKEMDGINVAAAIKGVGDSVVLPYYQDLLKSGSSLIGPGQRFGPYLEEATRLGFFNGRAIMSDSNGTGLGIRLEHSPQRSWLLMINERKAVLQVGEARDGALPIDPELVKQYLGDELDWRFSMEARGKK